MMYAKGGEKLSALDRELEDLAEEWRRCIGIAAATNNNSNNNSKNAAMTKEQLINTIIAWKFLKGKPRNALKPLLQSNSETSVKDCSSRAFEIAASIPHLTNDGNTTATATADGNDDSYHEIMSSAMNELCNLNGVGPATASAVLCLHRPDVFAFMDDEVIECLYDGKRGYTMKIYMEVNDACREIALELENARLSKIGDGKGGERGGGEFWTPCRVGKSLWSAATMSAVKDEDGLCAVFGEQKTEEKKGGRTTKRVKM